MAPWILPSSQAHRPLFLQSYPSLELECAIWAFVHLPNKRKKRHMSDTFSLLQLSAGPRVKHRSIRRQCALEAHFGKSARFSGRVLLRLFAHLVFGRGQSEQKDMTKAWGQELIDSDSDRTEQNRKHVSFKVYCGGTLPPPMPKSLKLSGPGSQAPSSWPRESLPHVALVVKDVCGPLLALTSSHAQPNDPALHRDFRLSDAILPLMRLSPELLNLLHFVFLQP